MIAADTNVVVRLVTNDDPRQSPRAAALFAREDIYLSKTVLLETEWVLRGAYRFKPAAIRTVFERLTALSSIVLEDRPAVLLALVWYARGLDFADALHVASSAAASEFATFDRSLTARARKASAAPGVTAL
jgi:predicted nucleic-acid-binding protein